MKTLTQHNTITRKLKTGVCALALAGIIGGASLSVPAYSADQKTTEKVETQVEQGTHKQTEQKRQKIAKEALAALQESSKALKFLDEGKTEDALAALEKATGKLDILLAREPSLSFVPVGVSSKSQNTVTSTETAKHMVKEVKKLLDAGRVQDARVLLSTLASETAITVTSLPMATYPAAMKEAAALIDKGEIDLAKTVLQVALNTLAVDVTIIPIPVANAEALLAQAEALANMAARTDVQNQALSKALSAAEEELKFAQVLGYGKKKDFDGFYRELNSIREKTSEGKSGTGFFEKITGYMNSITKDSQPESEPKN